MRQDPAPAPVSGVASWAAPVVGARSPAARWCSIGVPVLDILYVLAVIALFALFGLIAKAVEKL